MAQTIFSDRDIQKVLPQPKKFQLNAGRSLYLNVQPTGSKNWLFISKKSGKMVNVGLGAYSAQNNLAAAREQANRIIAMLEAGLNPHAVFKEEEEKRLADERRSKLQKRPETVSDLFVVWKKTELEHQRNAAGEIIRAGQKDEGAEVERKFKKDVFPEIGDLALATINTGDIMRIRDRVMRRGAGRIANQILSSLRQMFTFAVMRSWMPTDPTYGIKKEKFGGVEREKERTLDDNEVRELSIRLRLPNSATDPRGARSQAIERKYQLALLIQMACTCRIGELSQSQWKNVDFENRTLFFPADIRKGHRIHGRRDHTVFLSDFAIRCLKELQAITGQTPYLFPNRSGTSPLSDKAITKEVRDRQTIGAEQKRRSKSTEQLLLKSGNPWTPHDLRRTGSTLMIRALHADPAHGMSKESAEIIAERCLSHLPPDKLSRVYNQYGYDDEMLRGWKMLGGMLETMIPEWFFAPAPPKPSNIERFNKDMEIESYVKVLESWGKPKHLR